MNIYLYNYILHLFISFIIIIIIIYFWALFIHNVAIIVID